MLNTLSRFIPKKSALSPLRTPPVAASAGARGALETRPMNIEGAGTITSRSGVNALRMRPDALL